MDKNQILGFVLIFAVLIGWSIMTSPSKEEVARRQQVQDSIEQVKLAEEARIKEDIKAQEKVKVNIPVLSDSAAVEELKYSYGDFAPAAIGEEKNYTIKNDQLTLVFSSKGGFIKEATIHDYLKILGPQDKPTGKVPVKLLEDAKNSFSYSLPVGTRNQIVESKNLFFNGSVNGNTITLTATGQNGASLVQKYTLADEGYHVDYDLSYSGLGNAPVELEWIYYLDTIENNVQFEKRYSTVYYKETEEDGADYCSCAGDDLEDLSGIKVDWVSHANQFFNASLISKDNPFLQAELETAMLDENADDLKLTRSKLQMPVAGSQGSLNMAMYIGPNEYDRLVAYDIDLDEVIPFGNSIFGSINRHFIRPFFNFLKKYMGSIGLVIITVIFLIKMALYPLMYKMLHSQAKMGALKPELAKLKEKFKEEPQKVQMETMKIYREYGVSPFGGCLPMILQMPIWYALFRFFPASIGFRQESFLWATDLSSYDIWFNLGFTIPMFGGHVSLFTILWAITTIIYTYYNTKHMDMSANPAMKYVQYFMPIGFLAFFNSYASALTCYMFFSNVINIAQTIITKKYVFDDEKIRKELMKNKEKPKKKGGFQTRLEEAMKQQQQVAAQRKSKGSGPKNKK
jgi:YidC/Oxa1 family membrane protein insertase